ncbi:MAG: hexose kinase [Bacilli bacterium]|jgi:1-phosphofructokinase|nr:hexose kinase [Bacilli bacterium]
MIYSLTIAPALDYSLSMGDKPIKTDGVNRPRNDGFSIGGKGITVSMMLKNLKMDSTPIVALGGSVGNDLKNMIEEIFDNTIYLDTIGNSRIDVLITGSIHDLRFDPAAPKIADEGLEYLFKYFKEHLKKEDIVVLSGSLGQEKKDLYKEIIHECINPVGAKVILDTVGEGLTCALEEHPFMIKPNDEELGDLIGKEMNTDLDILAGGEELKKMGPQTVLVTMGKKGAYYFAEDGHIYRCSNAKGTQISAVGAGDSSIAGFIKGLAEGVSIEERLQFSMAAGGATAFSEHLGSYELWESLLPQIKVELVK